MIFQLILIYSLYHPYSINFRVVAYISVHAWIFWDLCKYQSVCMCIYIHEYVYMYVRRSVGMYA